MHQLVVLTHASSRAYFVNYQAHMEILLDCASLQQQKCSYLPAQHLKAIKRKAMKACQRLVPPHESETAKKVEQQ